MWALQGGRVAIAAQALGIGKAALDQAIAHAKYASNRPSDRQLRSDSVHDRRRRDRARPPGC
jgi:alkylation response protein AidB-like acyl-CoA dehydrogenase